jgi:hypothetical protein
MDVWDPDTNQRLIPRAVIRVVIRAVHGSMTVGHNPRMFLTVLSPGRFLGKSSRNFKSGARILVYIYILPFLSPGIVIVIPILNNSKS